jgi:hypothetical protein
VRPRHTAFISLVLGLSVAAGAFAAVRTVDLGVHSSKASATAKRKAIAHRKHQLDRFEASLRAALGTKPGKLPRMPHFKPVPKPAAISVTSPAATPVCRSVSAAPAQTPRVVYVQPHKVITIHRHGGEHEQEGHAGQGGGRDD